MPNSVPTSKLENFYLSPASQIPRGIINSGFLAKAKEMNLFQTFTQDAIRRHFRDYMKWPGMVKPGLALYVDDNNKSFDLLGHMDAGDGSEKLIINSGTAYDAYGNRLYLSERKTVYLTMSDSFSYLCVRKKSNYQPIDYVDHPINGVPRATRVVNDIEFYFSSTIYSFEVKLYDATDTEYAYTLYYAPLDSDNKIEGMVIAKIYSSASSAPEIDIKTKLLAVKNFDNTKGRTPPDISGFITILPAS